jgi:hypothetical protein
MVGRLDEDDPHDEVVGEVLESMNDSRGNEDGVARSERPAGVTGDE